MQENIGENCQPKVEARPTELCPAARILPSHMPRCRVRCEEGAGSLCAQMRNREGSETDDDEDLVGSLIVLNLNFRECPMGQPTITEIAVINHRP